MPSKIDLCGKRYGLLVVVSRVNIPGDKRTYWECRCDCGGTKTTWHGNLTCGHTTSCGCELAKSRSRIGKRNARDYSGIRSGRLVMIKRVESPNGRKGVFWLCKCDCGKEKISRGDVVARGQVISCGCALGIKSPIRPHSIRLKTSNYRRERRRNDVQFAIQTRIGNAVRKSLGRKSGAKTAKWERLLGYTAEELKSHLESTMPLGFTWSDFLSGELHIDHKRPLSSFSYTSTSDRDFLQAWSMSNLQLLTSADNMEKGSRII